MAGQQRNIDQLQPHFLLLSQKKRHCSLELRRSPKSSKRFRKWPQLPPVWFRAVCVCLSSHIAAVFECACMRACGIKTCECRAGKLSFLCVSGSACRRPANVWKQEVEKIKPNWPENGTDTFSLCNTHYPHIYACAFACGCVFVCACVQMQQQDSIKSAQEEMFMRIL